MMKRLILFLTALSLLALVGCAQPLPSADYNCSAAQYSESTAEHNVRIYYPVITGIENSESINASLEAYAMSQMKNYLTYNAPSTYYTYEISTVTATLQLPDIVSFLCVGSFYEQNAPHPESIVYTINLDPRDGSFYEFDELIADFDLLKEKFVGGKFYQLTGADDLLDQITYADMFTPYSELYGIYPPLYFIADDNDVMLAFSIEVVHPLGGHAEFGIDTDNVKKALAAPLRQIIYNEQ